MKPSLYTIYTNVISTLQSERDSISDDDFENQSMKLAAFVILMHSSMEFFLSRIIERVARLKLKNFPIAHDKVKGNLTNNKPHFDLFLSILLPECYENPNIWRSLEAKRNLCAHGGIFDNSNGGFKLKSEPIYKENIEEFFEYIKDTMEKLLHAVGNVEKIEV
jgi:hypothetical protein